MVKTIASLLAHMVMQDKLGTSMPVKVINYFVTSVSKFKLKKLLPVITCVLFLHYVFL